MEVFIENERGEHFHLVITNDDEESLNVIFDQFNTPKLKYVKKEDVHFKKPLTIDVMNFAKNIKIGTLTCERP